MAHSSPAPGDLELTGDPSSDGPRSDSSSPPPSSAASRTIPIHTPSFLECFVRRHAAPLLRRAGAVCRALGMADFAEDAVQQTIIRLMARGGPIIDTGADSALRYSYLVLRRICVDERRRRGRESASLGLGKASAGDTVDDSLAHLVTDLRTDLSAQVDARKTTRAALLCFEYLPSYADPAFRTAKQNLHAYWLGCVEGMKDAATAEALGLAKVNRTMRARGKRLLLGWLHAICGDCPQHTSEGASYQAAWQVGFDAGRAFVAAHPHWWQDEELSSGTRA